MRKIQDAEDEAEAMMLSSMSALCNTGLGPFMEGEFFAPDLTADEEKGLRSLVDACIANPSDPESVYALCSPPGSVEWGELPATMSAAWAALERRVFATISMGLVLSIFWREKARE